LDHEITKIRKHEITPDIEFEALSGRIINSAIEVHKKLGPGFLESIYQEALPIQLKKDGMRVEEQKEIDIYYDNQQVGVHRLDLVIDKEIIVELKTVKDFDDSHTAQVISYLKATGFKIGLLLNFSKASLQIKRIVL
jgi:GxxExxY protein